MSTTSLRSLPLLAALAVLPVLAPSVATAAEPTLEELLLATDEAARGERSRAVVEMQVKTDRYERSMKMESWADGTEKTLVRILEPAKDAGVATLKVEDNLWNYLPKVDRTMKVPAGMMSGSWMGSHFTNDDLVRSSRLSDDFTCAFEQKPEGGEGSYVIACTPKPDAPVVWGKLVATVRHDKVPETIEYFDEKGTLVRTMAYTDVKELDGRLTPTTMTLTPHDAPGEYTLMRFVELDFDADIPADTFTLQALKR